MQSSENKTSTQMTVLCVDDEINILKSMKRVLHKCDFTLLLAEGGEKGLAILAQKKVDLVISDMKMPGMTGAEFLAQVAEKYPETYRIILTGFSDMESTVDAVNKGKIHRYLQKPWDNTELVEAIDTGLEKVRLKHENTRLQLLIARQNKVLNELNHNLEDKVEIRTKQIRAALKRIQINNNATQKLLYNFISINPQLSGSFANSVSQLARRIARLLKLPNEQVDDISYAGLLCEIGLLGLSSELYDKSFSELNFNQQTEFYTQAHITQLILGPADHLQPIVDILTCQFEHYNGKGTPNKLFEDQIPIGARIIAVARDFWRFSMKKITNDEMTDIEIRTELKKFSGTRYDPEIIDILANNPDIVSDEHLEKPIPTTALTPGMRLKHNLLNDAHILILPEGHEFTEGTIAKLLQFERTQQSSLSIIVEAEVGEESS